MASIVYEGAGDRGTLFAGTKFFLQRRVPSRLHFIELVKSNGGEVVMLDKKADIVIADHARKDTPPGSISWTYIEQSVKNGRLENIEDHRAGPAERTVREVGSIMPTRVGRTPFTAEDDRVLMEWCARAERKGVPLKGNDLYKQLEEKNPRHTFQAWRDRWIKKLSMMPRPTLPGDRVGGGEEDEDEDDEPEDGPELRPPANRRHLPPARSLPSRLPARSPGPVVSMPRDQSPKLPPSRSSPAGPPRSDPKNRSPQISSPVHPFVLKSTGGTTFSDEETQQLFDFYDDIINLDDNKVIDAWIAFSVQNPNHTAQEWRNYFQEYIVPTKEQQDNENTDRRQKSHNVEIDAIIIRSSPPPKFRRISPEIADSQDKVDQILKQDSQRRLVDRTTTDEKAFKADLLALAEDYEIDVDFNPCICGKATPLFRIWQVVQSDEFGGYDEVEGQNLWRKVADRLNFNTFKHSTAAAEIRACYSEILADLENEKNEFAEYLATDSGDESALIEEQLRQTAVRETQNVDALGDEGEYDVFTSAPELLEEIDDNLDSPQYTPTHLPYNPSGIKRRVGTERLSNSNGYKKRPRIDKGKGRELEIPSTPEENNRQFQMPHSSHRPSPLVRSSPILQNVTRSRSESEELFVSPSPSPSKLQKSRTKPFQEPKYRILEPETQDFQFPADTAIEQRDQTSFATFSPPSNHSSVRLPSQKVSSNTATHGSLHSSSNKRDDSSTQSQTLSQQTAEFSGFLDHWIALGYSQDVVARVFEILNCRCDTGLASQIIDQVACEQSIPEDVRGVWTPKDVAAIEAGRTNPEFRRVVKKHGLEACKYRENYLRDQKQARAKEA